MCSRTLLVYSLSLSLSLSLFVSLFVSLSLSIYLSLSLSAMAPFIHADVRTILPTLRRAQLLTRPTPTSKALPSSLPSCTRLQNSLGVLQLLWQVESARQSTLLRTALERPLMGCTATPPRADQPPYQAVSSGDGGALMVPRVLCCMNSMLARC